jgi:hypothetical protein
MKDLKTLLWICAGLPGCIHNFASGSGFMQCLTRTSIHGRVFPSKDVQVASCSAKPYSSSIDDLIVRRMEESWNMR